MTSTEPDQLRARARRSYERGRVRVAVGTAALSLVPLALALVVWPGEWAALALVVPLFAALGVCVWRGEDAGQGGLAGLLAGSVPLVSLAAATRVGHLCAGGLCLALCVPICFFGGALAGVYVAWRGARAPRARMFWMAAGIVGSLTAAMGCVPMGLGATLGLLAGLALSAVPGAALAKTLG